MATKTERQVALLRGINVGKAKRVAMADLRALVEGLGYTDVRTLLNSGNVVYTASAKLAGGSAARIEAAIARDLGVSSRVTVLSAAELATVVRDNPLVEVADNHSRLFAMVLADAAARTAVLPLTRRDWAPEGFAVGKHAAYAWCPGGVLESPAMLAAGKALGDNVTTRNWATMLKIAALAGVE
ncbi:MAG: DUF1697 domain-containing protein [Vicinamibacterales bacterium]